MSYDLYFYKRKESGISKQEIAKYLSDNLVSQKEYNTQWFFVNEDTEVYFLIELNEAENDLEAIELYESFEGFDNTHFSFNLNFLRPSFFGLEAFQFIDKFISDLGLFILNPQGDFENPSLPTKEYLFNNWNEANLRSSKDHFDKQSYYYSPEKSTEIWKFNFNRKALQEEIGTGYFVSRIFFCKTLKDNNVVTLSTWTQHIPNILPKTDYYLLSRTFKKLFKTVTDTVLISRQILLDKFGNYFEDYSYGDCKIIHPEKAEKVGDIFNALKSDLVFEKFMVRIEMDNLYNAKP